MDSQDIIELIKKRRDYFWERQLIDSDDPHVLAAADCAKGIAAEYDYLLGEIQRVERIQLVQIASQQKTLLDE